MLHFLSPGGTKRQPPDEMSSHSFLPVFEGGTKGRIGLVTDQTLSRSSHHLQLIPHLRGLYMGSGGGCLYS